MTLLYRYTFDAVVCDEARMQLIVDGLDVAIQKKPLQILLMLMARAGQVVSRDELFAAVWAGRVGETSNVLPNAITKLRNALGDEAGARIENVPRSGYRFVGRVDRTVVGKRSVSELALSSGMPVPHRDEFVLERLLRQAAGREVWLARHRTNGDARVFKFASTAESVLALRREATVVRSLFDQLGPRDDLVDVAGWNFSSEPFFVETPYAGVDLAVWASADGRLAASTMDERLALFGRIADAVAAAHGIGVLHGDLKPGNVLVADDGKTPKIRIHDFGSGALVGPDWAERIGETLAAESSGRKASGTFAYLAPELHRGAVPTLRSDVFALGVLLYQLLVGDLDEPFTPAWTEKVADALLREDIAAATAADPAQRTANVDDLIGSIRRLDERRADRERRSASERAARLQREMSDRARARRPWLVAVVGLLAVGFFTTAALWLQVRHARQDLLAENKITTALNHFLLDDLIARADPSVSGRAGVTVLEAITEAVGRIDDSLALAGPGTRARIHASMQQALHTLGDPARSVDEGHAALRALDEGGSPDPAAVASVRLSLAWAFVDLARKDEAATELAAVATLVEEHHLQDSVVEAKLWLVRGWSAANELALEAQREDFRKAGAILDGMPDPPSEMREMVTSASAMASQMSGHFDVALREADDLLARQKRRWGSGHARVCYTQVFIAKTLGYLDRVGEAMPLAQSAAACVKAALGPANPRSISADDAIASLYYKTERWGDAVLLYRDIAARLAATSPTSLRTLNTRMNAASASRYLGHLDDAERELAGILETARGVLGETNPLVEACRYKLAGVRLDLHRTDGVEALLRGLTPDVLVKSQIAPDWEGRLVYEQGRLAMESGDPTRAIALLERAARDVRAHQESGAMEVETVERSLAAARRLPSKGMRTVS